MTHISKDKIQDLANDTSFLLNALVAIIESNSEVSESTLVGILNRVRDVNKRHEDLLTG